MRVVLSGGERGSYRSVLLANGVRRIGVNLTQFSVPTTKELDLQDKFGGAELTLYTSETDEDTGAFDSFLREHLDDLTLVVGMPGYDGGWIGDKYVPVWNDGDLERLAYLCEKVGRVAISDKAINKTTIPRIRQLQQRWGASLIGLTSKVDIIESLPWDTVIVSSWTSVVRYGETQIWDGHSLHRYPAQQKASARKKNRTAITRLGCDFDEVMEDNIEEVSKLAIRSWLEWEMARFHGAAYDPIRGIESQDDEEEFEPLNEQVATNEAEWTPGATSQNRGSALATTPPTPRNSGERRLLPIMGVESLLPAKSSDDESADEGDETPPEGTQTVTYKQGKLRNCDNCYLAPRCPAMTPGAECAYEIPVELKSKDQLMGVIRAMLEMQSTRVMFGAFAEELEGQGMDPQLSKEMDRLMNMIRQFKDISDTRDLLRIEVEAKGSAGVLSRIFGDKAGEKARALSEPVDSNRAAALMMGMTGSDSDIIDAQLVEGPQDQ